MFIHSNMIKQFYFKRFNLSCSLHLEFKCQIVLFDTEIGHGSDCNEGVLRILQSSSITPVQRCRGILQPQPTGLEATLRKISWKYRIWRKNVGTHRQKSKWVLINSLDSFMYGFQYNLEQYFFQYNLEQYFFNII